MIKKLPYFVIVLLMFLAMPLKAGTKEEKKLSRYEKIFDGKECKSIDGLLRLHIVDGHLFSEIPLDLMDRDMIITTTIEESSLADYGLVGQQPAKPYHIRFSLKDSVVRMHEIRVPSRTNAGENVENALEINEVQPIVAVYPIKAYNCDSTSVVIDNHRLFLNENTSLQAFEPSGISQFHVSTANTKTDLSVLKDIRGGKDYSSIISDMTYGVTTQYFIFVMFKDKPFTAVANRTISLLDEEVAPLRIADPRIGVVPVGLRNYTIDKGAKPKYYSSRIDMGTKKEPRNLVVYVDTLFKPVWYKGIERGVKMWNSAFERIGMGNPFSVEPYSSDESFDSNSPHGFFVKYATSTSSKVVVNTTTDPRSGEVMGAHIVIPENITYNALGQRFICLSTVDPDSRDWVLDDVELEQELAMNTARAMSSVLGLATNYAAAAAYPTDSLRSASFTQACGLNSSITSPNSYNYIAQIGDKGARLVNDCLGLYDYFAIDWLYSEVDGDEQGVEAVLTEKLSQKSGDPFYYYGNFWYDFYFGDVRMAYNNMGEDPLSRVHYRLNNLKYVAENAKSWLEGNDHDGSYREEIISSISNGTIEVLSYLAYYIGGIYYTEVVEGDGQQMMTVVPKEKQRMYLREIIELIDDMSWMDTDISNGHIGKLSESIQAKLVGTLIKRMETLPRYQMGLDGEYTQAEMFDDLIDIVFDDVRAGRMSSFVHKQLQMGLSGYLVNLSEVAKQPAKAGSKSFVEGFVKLKGPLFENQARAVNEPISAYNEYRRVYTPSSFSSHVHMKTLERVRDIYIKGAKRSKTAEAKEYHAFMVDKLTEYLSF